jgi:ubiquinone/menaquinone biosynthesis C-methylase UbiE
MAEPKGPQIGDPAFWDSSVDYRSIANDFTAYYSQRAWEIAGLPQDARVLDIAAGAGALARIAADAGNAVLATDFSPAMVQSIADLQHPRIEAVVMDGHALDIADGAFDAAFSMFGIMLFPDWSKGLSEMARVLRAGGLGCIGTWANPAGAAANLLLARMTADLAPALQVPEMTPGMTAWTDPARFHADLTDAGFGNLSYHRVTSDFLISPTLLAAPDRLFQFSPIWPRLSGVQQDRIVGELREETTRRGSALTVASPAKIAFGHKL